MKIEGQIVDANNEPLVSANITLKSGAKAGKVGTISNLDGYFVLESDDFDSSSLFEVSYIGFVKQTFIASELQNKKIKLLEAIDVLDEVVLVGTKPFKTTIFTSPASKEKITDVKEHLYKHRLTYAGISGLLGLAIIGLTIKNKL